jgi:hypothetical protein
MDSERCLAMLFALYLMEDGYIYMNLEDKDLEEHSLLRLGGLSRERYKTLYTETEAELVAYALEHQDDPEEAEDDDDPEIEVEMDDYGDEDDEE